MRSFPQGFLAAVAVFALAGAAQAASISVVTPEGQSWMDLAAPSEMITVEVRMDGAGLPGTGAIASMFFHVDFSSNLSLVSRTYATGLPGVFWGSLSGHGTVDADGLYTAQYDVTDTGGLFANTTIVTMVFHVVDPGPGYAAITPIFATGDAIGGGAADGFPNLTPYFTELNSFYIPEPGAALLLGLSVLTIGCAGRRR